MTQRVLEQVAKDLTEPHRVDVDHRQIGGDIGRQLDPVFIRSAPVDRHDVIDQGSRRERLTMQYQCTGFGCRQRAQVLQEAREDIRFVEQSSQVLRVGRVQPVEHGLGVAADHRERGPQLVCEVGQQLPAPGFVVLQAVGHAIERIGESSVITTTPWFDASGEISVGHTPDSFHHVPHRSRRPTHASHDGHPGEGEANHQEEGEREEATPAIPRTTIPAPSEHGAQHPPRHHQEQEEHPGAQQHPTKEPAAHASPGVPSAFGWERFSLRPPRRPPPAPWRAAGLVAVSVRPALRHRRTGSPHRAR